MSDNGHGTSSSKRISTETQTIKDSTGSVAVSSDGKVASSKIEAITNFFSYDAPLDFTHLFWIFTICSVLGLFVEAIVSFPIDGYWKNRAGLVWGPFSPIYGVGGVLMSIFLHPVRKWSLWKIFILAAVIGGLFEYAVSYFWEMGFGAVAWSYENEPLNFNGRTCVGVDLGWGLAGILWIKLLLPCMMRVVDLVPQRVLTVSTILCVAFVFTDVALTLGAMDCWYNRLAGNPIQGPYQEFFNTYFGDEFMDRRFQTITIWSQLAIRS